SIPYAVNKAVLVERIGEIVLGRKMPLLLNVKDVSTEDVRIELELKKEADEAKVLAYLFKNTSLQTNFAVNLTCLVPTENPEVGKAGKRRTIIEAVGEEATFTEEELIIAEDNHVLITRDGWVKRQREIKDPSTTRLREGDQVLSVVAGSTKSTVVFFSSYG